MRNNVEDRSLWHCYLFETIFGDSKLSFQRMDYSTMDVSNIITFLFQDNFSTEWQEKIHITARDVKQKPSERIKPFMN